MADAVLFVADAGKEAGLGHIGRSSAVAVALRCRGIEPRCYARGVDRVLERDGVVWLPLGEKQPLPSDARVLVVDSYRVAHDDLRRAARSAHLVVMHDYGGVPEGAALIVSVAATAPSGGAGWLAGPAYAALRPGFWGLPERAPGQSVRRVLVTTGSGHVELGSILSQAIARSLPDSEVALVRGPHARIPAPPGVEMLDTPDSLLEPLLSADMVVSAAGQTMLEAAAAGTPCIALPLVENQRRQAARLAELGAVALVDPPTPDGVTDSCSKLAHDAEARCRLSRDGQVAVDGYGALRVAFEIARLGDSRR